MNETILINISKADFESLIKSYIVEANKELLNRLNIVEEYKKLKEQNELNDFIKEKDLANILGLNKVTLYHWRKRGKIKFKKLGRMVYYDKKDVNNIFKTNIV